jgi:hypothetical protein
VRSPPPPQAAPTKSQPTDTVKNND